MTTFLDTVTGDLKFISADGYTVIIANDSHDGPSATAYSASLTPDLTSVTTIQGAVVQLAALTGNLIFDVSNVPAAGGLLIVRALQDGYGTYRITWDDKFYFGLLYSNQPAFEANSKTHWTFYIADSTHLECIGREEIGASSEYSITAAGQVLRADRINVLSSSATTASLPAISIWAGRPISVKLDNLSSVVISPNGAETINGQATHTITSTGAGLCAGAVYTNNSSTKVRGWPE